MKSVGLITAWRDNYGSVLQCYATKTYVKKLGFHCELFYEENKGIERYKHYVRRGWFLSSRALRSKEFYRKYKIMKSNALHNIAKIEKASRELIYDFAQTKLQPKGIDYILLKQIAASDEYIAFLAGSDQIWNGQTPANPVCFLSFAPQHKKIALAPSFGTDCVAGYNRRDFKKYISKFAYLSVREDAGVDIVKSLTGKTVERLADPSILLTPEQWRIFAQKGCKRNRPYILLHFLDQPNEAAVAAIEQMQKQTLYDIVILAYNHQEFKRLDNAVLLNGTPEDYVSLIDGAAYVCTDSFHTTLFSIYLDSPFFTFERTYQEVASQTSRLHTLLKLYGYESRFIDKLGTRQVLEQEWHSCQGKLNEERQKLEKYLKEALGVEHTVTCAKPNLKDRIDCTGCGVCVAVCPQRAITFKRDPLYDYAIPVIDRAKCVSCGVCEKKCRSVLPKTRENLAEKRAYIAYNTNPVMRNKSASGGIFSAVAKQFIINGGVVFGVKLDWSGEKVDVYQAKAETEEELLPLLNSKYVQSNCVDSYPLVKHYLDQGREVLFSGTSCQVKALYNYLEKDYVNLYTMDLICHGVPGWYLFEAYVSYLEEKLQGRIVDFSFRKKRSYGSFYVITVEFETESGNRTADIEMKDSAYYQMFMSENSYREACYKCEFASIDKPADITLGDYYEAKDDYPELFDGTVRSLRIEDGLSSVIAHTTAGEHLLASASEAIEKIIVDVSKVQRSHSQLCKPSMYSQERKRCFHMYRYGGYGRIEKYIARIGALKSIVKAILRMQ